jgi:glyoxylate/hydroxypyruvate reductase
MKRLSTVSSNVNNLLLGRSLKSNVGCILLCKRNEMSSELSASGPKVFVTRRVPQIGVDLLRTAGCQVSQWDSDDPVPQGELLKGVRECNALFCMLTDRIDKDVLDAAGPSLKVIGTMSVGYEHINLAECRARQITVGYTPDVLTDATAELTVALLLATSRRLVEAVKAVKTGEWKTWSPLWMCGHGLTGATVGIVGLGRIGFAVAKRLRPFNVGCLLYAGRSQKSIAADVGAEYVPFSSLLAKSDFVIATCPLTPETTGIFNRATFMQMKRSAVFINTSRGGIVNQEDLYEALHSGTVAAAGLDVTTPEPLPIDHKLLSLENCVILPHIGSATVEVRTAMSELTARNIIAGLTGQKMPNELLV